MANHLALQRRFLHGHGPRIHWREQDYAKLARAYGVGEDVVVKLVQREPEQEIGLPAGGIKAAGDVRKAFGFTISDGAVDRMNDIVSVAGIDTTAYRRNPTVLFNHNARGLPIGRSTSIGIVGGKLKATVELAVEALDLAERVRALIAHGSLKGASIGFMPVRWNFNRERGGIDFHETSLLEWSIVTTPAAPGALIEPGQTGKAMSEHDWRAHERSKARRRRALELIQLGAR